MNKRIQDLKDEFTSITQWEDRYKKLIEIGRDLPEMDEADMIDKFIIKGCQSQVWLKPSYNDGKIYFTASSDAMIVKGIVGMLVRVYSGSTADEVLETSTDFLEELGITEHLTMNRTNGLKNMVKQIKLYALAYKTLG